MLSTICRICTVSLRPCLNGSLLFSVLRGLPTGRLVIFTKALLGGNGDHGHQPFEPGIR